MHWNTPLAQRTPNIVVAEGPVLSCKYHWYLLQLLYSIKYKCKGKAAKEENLKYVAVILNKTGFLLQDHVSSPTSIDTFWRKLLLSASSGRKRDWILASFFLWKYFWHTFLVAIFRLLNEKGHDLLDLVDLVGIGPYNRMVWLICQAINGSSIPTSAGMTIFMEITGWYLKSRANGCWYSTDDGAWGSGKIFRGEKMVKKSYFTKHPGLWLTWNIPLQYFHISLFQGRTTEV